MILPQLGQEERTPGLIENVVVTVYGGQKMRLIELGSISVPDVRSLTFSLGINSD
jgi:ribosome recycling factor